MKSQIIALTLLVTVTLMLSGCGKPQPLNVGKIDTNQIMMQLPQFKELGEEKTKMEKELERQIGQQAASRPLTEAEKTKYKDMLKKWETLKRKFFEETFQLLRDATRKVAEEKKYDLVVVDTSFSPVVQYGGTDITPLLLYELKSTPPAK